MLDNGSSAKSLEVPAGLEPGAVPYVCPKCGEGLAPEAGGLACPRCGQVASVEGGVPDFIRRPDFYWGEMPRAELQTILRLIEGQGWPAAIDYLRARFPNRDKFVLGGGRTDWRFCLPLRRDFTVLDAGCGMGAHSFTLARLCRWVVCFDMSFERVRFVEQRRRQEGLANLQPFVGSLHALPLPPESFDLATLNGVLEWAGVEGAPANPRRVQLDALRRIGRLLRPGGYLYVGIENRLANNYLWGGHDHSGLRLTSWMPRALADAYCRLRLGTGYRTYTYTRSGYRRLLHEAGYHDVRFFLPYPSYNAPDYIFPDDDLNALKYIRQVVRLDSRKRRLLASFIGLSPVARLYRYLFFSFIIVARKGRP